MKTESTETQEKKFETLEEAAMDVLNSPKKFAEMDIYPKNIHDVDWDLFKACGKALFGYAEINDTPKGRALRVAVENSSDDDSEDVRVTYRDEIERLNKIFPIGAIS